VGITTLIFTNQGYICFSLFSTDSNTTATSVIEFSVDGVVPYFELLRNVIDICIGLGNNNLY
jgi:hypothetical protein